MDAYSPRRFKGSRAGSKAPVPVVIFWVMCLSGRWQPPT